jgi:glycosyltransferase involved in cell wall biosynthesis
MEQKPTAAAWFQDIDPKCFVFYTIAEWIPRKACELTIHAFLRAFQSSDNCRLIIKTGLYDRSLPGWQQRLFPVRRQILRIRSCYKQPAKVELIDKNISREQINALHRRGNCFVSLTRGEGWGLGAFEAAAAGNAIVITGYGGQIEYLPENYPYLVNYNLVHVKQNRRWSSYGANQVWAEPDVVHAAHLLRRLLTNAREAKQIGEALKTNMANRYGEKVVIEKLLDLLKQL